MPRKSIYEEDEANQRFTDKVFWLKDHAPVPYIDVGAARSDVLIR